MANCDETASDSTGDDVQGVNPAIELQNENDTELESKLRLMFGDETVKAFEAEELLNAESMKDLCNRDADAPIFSRLQLNYGKAVRFKGEFAKYFPQKRTSPSNQTKVKPRMVDIAFFSPEQKSTYLLKRRKIGVLASARWKKEVPKFNSPQMKAELANFASEIAPQCAMPDVGFNEEGIMKHVQAYFSEQRRYRGDKSRAKKKCLSEDPKLPELDVSSGKKKCLSKDPKLPELNASSSKSDSDDNEPVSQRAKSKDSSDNDTMSVSEDDTLSSLSEYSQELEEESALTSKGDSPQSNLPVEQSATPIISLRGYQMIVKAVFGQPLNRDDIVKVLKNKFLVKTTSLTSLSMSQLTEVIAKKLLNNRYCSLKQGANLGKNIKMEDITVHKEISI